MLGLQTFVFIIDLLYSVGGFQAPTDADDGQNGHHRKGRESSESGRQRQRDSNMNIDENISGEDNQNMPTDDDEPPVDIETMTKALQEVSLENRMKEQLAAAASVEKTTEEKVPVDPADMEHYTPPGTPQELSPANDQQIADMVSDLEKVE
uniref:Uncharacterized protein n=1 Tax=Panagrolaimus sp. JU765 TaxID=591449 RepID=A0AC34PWZ6_9BILA